MTPRCSTFVLALFVAVATPMVSAAQQTPPTPPTPAPAQNRPTPKASASIAGKWDMSAETPQGTEASTLVIKLDGKKVTGTMSEPTGRNPASKANTWTESCRR